MKKWIKDLLKSCLLFLKKLWDSNFLKITLIVIIIFLLLIDLYGLSLFREVPDYERLGTVGDWFSNFATLITIIVAAVTIVNDKRIAENERKYNQSVRESDQIEREKERAEKMELLSKAVFVWIRGEQDQITGEIANYRLLVSNKTGAPVFEWNIYTENQKMLASSNNFGPLLPENIMEVSVKELNSNTSISIVFISFDGKRWSRTGADVKEEPYG